MAILTDEELREALAGRRGWRRVGDALVRERACRDFAEALALLERLGEAAEDYGRHPEMAIAEGNRVRIRVANPNGAGFTDAELRLVVKVDEVAAAVAAEAAQPPRSRGPLAAVAAAAAAVPALAEQLSPLPAAPDPEPAALPPAPEPAPAQDHRDAAQQAPARRAGMLAAALGGAVVGAVASRAARRR